MQPHRHLALAFGGATDRVDRIEHHFGTALDVRFDGFQRGVDRPVAVCITLEFLAVDGDHDAGMRALAGFAVLGQRDETVLLLFLHDAFLADQGQDVFVKDFTLAVGQFLETRERGVDRGFTVHLNAEFLQPLLEGIAPAELPQHDLVVAPAHVLGTHDFIGVACLEHAVLVDAAGVGKGVGADHGLVRLDHKTGGLADHAAGGQDVLGIDPHVQTKVVASRLDRHHHFFQ